MTEEVTDKIVIALVGNLGDPNQGDPQVSIHTSVDRDSQDLDGLLDRIHASFARQKAAAEIVRVEKHIRQCEKMIAQAKANDDVREDMYLAECARVRAEAQKLQDQVPGILAKDEQGWNEKERAGPYKLTTQAQRTIDLLKKDASKCAVDLANLALVRDQALKTLADTQNSWVSEIVADRDEIERLKAIVG